MEDTPEKQDESDKDWPLSPLSNYIKRYANYGPFTIYVLPENAVGEHGVLITVSHNDIISSREKFAEYCQGIAKSLLWDKVLDAGLYSEAILAAFKENYLYLTMDSYFIDFVTNSIDSFTHAKKTDDILILVSFNLDSQSKLSIIIEDNGNGFNPDVLSKLNEIIQNTKQGIDSKKIVSQKTRGQGFLGGYGKGMHAIIKSVLINPETKKLRPDVDIVLDNNPESKGARITITTPSLSSQLSNTTTPEDFSRPTTPTQFNGVQNKKLDLNLEGFDWNSSDRQAGLNASQAFSPVIKHDSPRQNHDFIDTDNEQFGPCKIYFLDEDRADNHAVIVKITAIDLALIKIMYKYPDIITILKKNADLIQIMAENPHLVESMIKHSNLIEYMSDNPNLIQIMVKNADLVKIIAESPDLITIMRTYEYKIKEIIDQINNFNEVISGLGSHYLWNSVLHASRYDANTISAFEQHDLFSSMVDYFIEFVKNSIDSFIKHKKIDDLCIVVNFNLNDSSQISISIEDNGNGFDDNVLSELNTRIEDVKQGRVSTIMSSEKSREDGYLGGGGFGMHATLQSVLINPYTEEVRPGVNIVLDNNPDTHGAIITMIAPSLTCTESQNITDEDTLSPEITLDPIGTISPETTHSSPINKDLRDNPNRLFNLKIQNPKPKTPDFLKQPSSPKK